MGGDAEVLTKIPQGTSSHEWAPVGNKLLLVITDPKPEELTADKEDDKSKTFCHRPSSKTRLCRLS
jgi:hypothetical protein